MSALLQAEDDKLDAERRRGQRTAAHLLGAMRRQTELLLMDRSFPAPIEVSLPAEVESVKASRRSGARCRTGCTPWSSGGWWTGSRCGGAVLADLEGLQLARPATSTRAELLVPALPRRRCERGWGEHA
ncbi:MAG: hypothetical protein R3F59_20700 [Myxococcota bacterium]